MQHYETLLHNTTFYDSMVYKNREIALFLSQQSLKRIRPHETLPIQPKISPKIALQLIQQDVFRGYVRRNCVWIVIKGHFKCFDQRKQFNLG